MPTLVVQVRRVSVVSSKPFEEVVRSLTDTIGHPDMDVFYRAVAAAITAEDVERVLRGALGPSGLMEFDRFDAGELLRKQRGARGPKIIRLVVGNPIMITEMAKTVPDAVAYALITIFIDERSDGVHLAYDSMVSLIAPYSSDAALLLARDLDAKIEGLLEMAAR